MHNERNELYGTVSDKTLTYSGTTITGGTLKIQVIQVQASSAALCDSITNGTYVEVKGTLSNGVLTATRMEFDGSASGGYSEDWSDTDGLRHRTLSTPGTPTALQAARSFEMYGALSCSAVNEGCTLTRGGIAYTADMLSASWGGHQPITNGYVEAKGYLTGTGTTFKVSKIESKDRHYDAGHGADD